MDHKGTIRIETQRLLLRPFSLKDAASAFRNWMGDEKVTEYLRWKPHRNIEETKDTLLRWTALYKDPAFYQWAIELKEIHEPIGTISVVDQERMTEKVHIGYCIGSKWWHQRITSEAFSAVIPFLFKEVNANRIKPTGATKVLWMHACTACSGMNGFVITTLSHKAYGSSSIMATAAYKAPIHFATSKTP